MVDNIRESKPCCICDKESYQVLYQWPSNFYDHDKFETASWDGRQSINLQIVRCVNCGTVYTNPSFKAESLHLVYPEDLIQTETRDKNELLKEQKWNELIDLIIHFLPEGSTVCDVGTRYGILPEKIREKGYNTFGIELNQGAVEYAEKIGIEEVYHSDIFGINHVLNQKGIKNVNAFVLDDVLEHLVDPFKELSTLSSAQSKGDYFVLRQMDHDSWGRKIFRKNWYYYQPAAHMYFFDDKSIKALLDKVGYEVVKTIKTPPKHQLKPFVVQILRKFGVAKYQFPTQLNGKRMYLDKRFKLEDMFVVVARKK